MKLDREKLAWAAGFFDGEGTTCAFFRENSRGCPYRSFSLSVSQAGDFAPEILERFRQAVGGIGKVYEVHGRKRKDHHKKGYSWRVANFKEVQAVIAMLWTWMGPQKRSQAQAAVNSYLNWPRTGMTAERGRAMANRRWSGAKAIHCNQGQAGISGEVS